MGFRLLSVLRHGGNELGGHCRTGLEDNVRLDKDTLAPSNAALVRQVGDMCGEYGRRVAKVANAATYSWVDSALGDGMVGGSLYNQKEAIELLSKAILELALSIEATDAKVKKINKSS